MHVIFITPEVAPYTNQGSIGEFAGALPAALCELGHQVTLVAPFYQEIDPESFGLARRIRTIEVPLGTEQVEVGLLEGQLPASKVSVVLIDHPESFGRPGLYGEDGADYADNHRRFALLSAAALRVAEELDLEADIVHFNDWSTGLLPLLLKQGVVNAPGLEECKTVFTVHDPALAGLFPAATLEELGLGYEAYNPEGIEFHGNASWFKAGLVLADRVTTHSPSFARELATEELGFGFDGVVRSLGTAVAGVLPGVDQSVWDPATDHRIDACYSVEDLEGKADCKRALQQELGLARRADVALVAMVGPLTEARGVELVLEALPQLPLDRLQLALFGGPASEELAARLGEAQQQHPSVVLGPQPDAALTHRVLAGADALLALTQCEPGGMTPLRALRYGTAPVVFATGGMLDTVVDFDAHSATGTGFHFGQWDAAALAGALQRLLQIQVKPELRRALVRNAMAQHFPWHQTARMYAGIYQQLTGQ